MAKNQKAGWHFFAPETAILKACKATKGDTNAHGAKRRWLTATTDTLPHQARLVLQLIDEGTTKGLFNKNAGKHINLDVSAFSLAGAFRKAVEALASGPVANHLENSPHMGMAAARKYLDNHLNLPLQSPVSGPRLP